MSIIPDVIQDPYSESMKQKSSEFYEKIAYLLKGRKLSYSTITNVAIAGIQIVDNYKELNGKSKKYFIIQTIDKIIDDTILDKQEAENHKIITKFTLPSFIDIAIKIDKKELRLKIRKKCSKICF